MSGSSTVSWMQIVGKNSAGWGGRCWTLRRRNQSMINQTHPLTLKFVRYTSASDEESIASSTRSYRSAMRKRKKNGRQLLGSLESRKIDGSGKAVRRRRSSPDKTEEAFREMLPQFRKAMSPDEKSGGTERSCSSHARRIASWGAR